MYIGSQASSGGLIVGVNADGSLTVYIGDGENSFTSASGVFTFGNRHEVECKVSEFNTSGTVTIYLDGVAVTGLTTVAPTNISGTVLALNDGATIHSVAVGGGLFGGLNSTPIVVDSVYCLDTTGGSPCNAPLGPSISIPMFPAAPGNKSQFAAVGASLGWECIQEVPPDGDTTYISDATSGHEETCELTAPFGISAVYGVSVISDQRQDTSGGGRTIEIGVGSGSSQSYGSAWALGTSYKMNTTPFSSNPLTSSAWALADLSTLQVAAKIAS